MQLMPETAKGIAAAPAVASSGSTTFSTPRSTSATAPGTSATSSTSTATTHGLAAYNAGQQNVDDWMEAGRGIVFVETRDFVETVEDLKKIYRRNYFRRHTGETRFPREPPRQIDAFLAVWLRRAEPASAA